MTSPEERANTERQPAPAWRKPVGWAVGGAILVGLVWVFCQRWGQLPQGAFQGKGWLVAVGVPAFLVHGALYAAQWRRLMQALNVSLSLRAAMGIHFLSQAGKYVPGKVMLFVGKVYLCGRQGVALRTATLSVAWEQALIIISGAVVVLLSSMGAGMPVLREHRVPLLILCAAGLACLHPRVVRGVLGLLRRVWPNAPELETLSGRATIEIVLRYGLVWVLNGGLLYGLAWGLHGLSPKYAADCVGILTLGGIVGFVTLIAPGGIGVRDATMSALLSAYMPLPMAIAVSLAHRVLATAADLIALALAVGLRRHWDRGAGE